MGNKSTKSLIIDEINSLILSANQSYNQDIDQPIEILPEIEKLVDAVKILTNETPYDDHFYCDLFLILINIYIKQKKYHHACFCCLKAEQIARKINSGKHIAFCLNRQDETARLSGGLNQKCQLNGKNCQSIHLTSFLFEDTSNDLLSSNQKTILSDCLVGNKEFLKACIRALGNAKFYNNLNRISVMSARYTSICTQSLIEMLNISAYRIEKQLTGAAHTGISFTDDVACKLNDDQVFLFTFVTYTLLKNILVTKFAKNTCCGEESNGNTFSKSRTNVTKEEEYGQVNRNYQSTETITTPKINDSFSNFITPFEKLIRLYRQNSQLNESLQSYFTWNNNTANKPSQAIKFCSNNISVAHSIAYYPFIPKSNLYIIPLNMTDAINETLQNWHYSSERISYLETFKEWLVTIIGKDTSQNRLSITMNEQTQEYSLPIIILVGLHQGKIHEEQTCQFEQLIQGLLKSLPFLKSHVVSSKIIFNSNLQDNHLDIINNRRQCRNELMAMIRQFLQSLPLSQENIPAKWLFMGQILHEAVQKHHNQELSINLFDNIMGYSIHKIMKVDDIRQLSRDIGLYEDENFFLDMLSYLNDAGDILYCQNEGIIVTDLQWLVNIAGHASKWYPQRYKDMEFHDELGQINYLKKINCEWLNSLASHFNFDDMERKMIIDVLKIYGIISEISDSDKQYQDNRGYFIPYVLPQYVEEEPNTIKPYEKSDWLHVGYNVQDQVPYIPDNLFRDLISSCLKEWGNPLVQFFHRYAKYFFLNNQYCIVVKKEKSTVAMQYQYEILDNSTSKNTLVHNVKNFIDKFSPHSVLLEELISITNKKMPKFENIRGQFYLKCDLCQRLNGITDVHQRLGYQQIKCQECYSPMSFKALDDWNLGNKVNVKGML
ncbi:uncharacterized protein TRIADDRAFT_52777 [Trichoplax adhaerens]|uniref:C-terminal of Roc (COR) domain-containing protein n=1 Tax=Trichoplax adhaerens TaxID=10228 RepID=B3RKA9_TRIAD|nr:predicted protein [Trichoplax adhaerens]EDV29895.1 predicted protein [Trichoplax adhaerens]|eukprot:XP_002109097.1 predicted protein [Trichoplax adhaerens]